MGVLVGAWNTHHWQPPRLLLLMSPSLGVTDETWTTYHSQPPRLLLLCRHPPVKVSSFIEERNRSMYKENNTLPSGKCIFRKGQQDVIYM
jgi:hypothetical protein